MPETLVARGPRGQAGWCDPASPRRTAGPAMGDRRGRTSLRADPLLDPARARQAGVMADSGLIFGAGLGGKSTRDEVISAARTAEAAGFDVLNTPDHLGSTAPFAVLAAAAAVTERVRLRTYVL